MLEIYGNNTLLVRGISKIFLNSVAKVATQYLSAGDVKSEHSVRNKYQTKPARNWLNLVIYNNFHFAQTSCLQKHALEGVAVPYGRPKEAQESALSGTITQNVFFKW